MHEEVSLTQMMDAREARALRQLALLKKHRCSLVSFTMNIAGPIKDTPLIRQGFELGCRLLEGQLLRLNVPVRERMETRAFTGCEMIWAVEADPAALKQAAVLLEDETPPGRLFDMDILTPEGGHISRTDLGYPARRCLICGRDAKGCARSRAHTVEQLQEKTRSLLLAAVRGDTTSRIASLACRALMYEVCTTPKPGLVDRNNNGSHRDMDIYTFMDSVSVLSPYFEACVSLGWDTAELPAEETFRRLRRPGMLAEGTMLQATGGVNTHKGAIFTLGIVSAALGRLHARTGACRPEDVLSECAALTKGLTAQDFSGVTAENARTAGERFWALYGLTGIRGQLEAGLPAVRDWGLPVLKEGLRRGKTKDEAGAAALLAILAHDEDTNMTRRGGEEARRARAKEAADLLAHTPYPSPETLAALDADYIRNNLSPGGSADLLAVCWLLCFAEGGSRDSREAK